MKLVDKSMRVVFVVVLVGLLFVCGVVAPPPVDDGGANESNNNAAANNNNNANNGNAANNNNNAANSNADTSNAATSENSENSENSEDSEDDGPIYILPLGPVGPLQPAQPMPAVSGFVEVGECVNCVFKAVGKTEEVPALLQSNERVRVRRRAGHPPAAAPANQPKTEDIFLIPYKHNPLENQNPTDPFNQPPPGVKAGMGDSPFAAQAAIGVFPAHNQGEESSAEGSEAAGDEGTDTGATDEGTDTGAGDEQVDDGGAN